MSRYNNLQIPTAIRPDVKLGKLTVSRIGKYFAYNESLDGYNVVEIKPQQLTATERDFLCGNPLKSTIVLDEDVTAVVTDVSSAFPNLKRVLVGNSTQVVTGLDTMIGDLQGVTVIVPNSLESAYQTAYPNLTFDSWVFDVVFTIPYIGDSTLTADYVRAVVQTTSGQIESVTKVIVPDDFTDYSAGALDEIFTQFTAMTDIESPWINGNVNDGLLLKLSGSGTLTAEIVEEQIEGLGNVTAGRIAKLVVPAEFTAIEDGALDVIDSSSLTNIQWLELDVPGNATINLFNAYSNYTSDNAKIKKYILRSSGSLSNVVTCDNTWYQPRHINATEFIVDGFGTFRGITGASNLTRFEAKNIESVGNTSFTGLMSLGKLILPSSITFFPSGDRMFYNGTGIKPRKIFFEFDIVLSQSASGQNYLFYYTDYQLYVKAQKLQDYVAQPAFVDHTVNGILAGFLDYTDTIPSFSGYTDQWYEDEDCTTSIATSAFVSGNRYFVKLTAI